MFIACPSFSASHRQDYTELCLAAHHARESFSGFFKRICFNHGSHAAQRSKVKSIFGIGGRSRSPALNTSTSTNKLHWRDLNGIECRADHDELAIRP